MTEMGAAEFKAHCLEALERVRRTRQPILVTKRGVPCARVVPVDRTSPREFFGCMEGRIEIVGDVVSSSRADEDWRALERRRVRGSASSRRPRR